MRTNHAQSGVPRLDLSQVNPRIVTAAVLLLIMAGMWARVYLRGRSGPASASAQALQDVRTACEKTDRSVRISPVSLPVIEGKHDRLSADPFVPGPSFWSPRPSAPAAGTAPADPLREQMRIHEQNLRKIEERLKLEAVICSAQGQPIKASIDGQVLQEGQALKIKEGGHQYELTVQKVLDDEVNLAWQTFSVKVKMASGNWIE